ncbi:hypothetical protein FQR65_LT09295 [Abscondita terminalis]|nr:hypothetical protein FQR65_LT09295 [Abscondita terminalis]
MFTLKDNIKFKILYYVILAFVAAFYAIEFGIGHYTNTLVLLMESYCTLCNVLGLIAVVIANKFGAGETAIENLVVWTTNTPVSLSGDPSKLRNTFGWKRYLTLSLLIRYVFLSSSAFSLSLEAIESLTDTENYTKKTDYNLALYVGIAGILLNLFFHSATHDCINYYNTPLKNSSPNVTTNALPNAITDSSTDLKTERVSKSKNCKLKIKAIFSSFIGPIFVVVYSSVAYCDNLYLSAYTDSVLTLLLGAIQLILNFSLMKDSCAILLQKIPDTIDIDHLRTQLLQSFPDVLNVHDLHVWQLTAEKVVSTVHITFKNPAVYPQLTSHLLIFFQRFGIDQATIQPEFLKDDLSRSIQFANVAPSCLIECQTDECKESFCCPTFPQVISRKNKTMFKESVLDGGSVSVKSMKVYGTQQTFLNKSFSCD